MRRLLGRLVTLLLCAGPIFGWWETGHRAVARIAAAHLTPVARTRIARILAVTDTPEAVADALADAAVWADETKKNTKTSDWHFIDLTIQDRKTDIPMRCPDGNCLPGRIQVFSAELKAHHPDPRWSELDVLRYLVHFVGDAHQPLHAATDADQGGNCEQLTQPFHLAQNLHGLWDGGILATMDPDDRALSARLDESIGKMSVHEVHKLSEGSVNDWIWESHETALRDIYFKLHVPVEPALFPSACDQAPAEIQSFKLTVDPAYVDAMKPVIDSQITKAGLRLARVLNEAL
ncbi:MAG: S1/P1 nuclease [Acidobacteriaceae bacterium]|nr:S1/P1 nuclease [Acidobacteriaceae bacterium]